MTRIALVGLKRSGKDTFGRIATDEYSFTRMAFADNVKQLAHKLYPEEYKDTDKPVELLQWLGETLRQRNPDVWINLFADDLMISDAVDTMYDMDSNIVVTDCRYQNEVDFLKSKGFIIIKIETDFIECCRRCAETEKGWDFYQMFHTSEALAREGDSHLFDVIMTNNGTLEEFEQRVRGYLNVLLGGNNNE